MVPDWFIQVIWFIAGVFATGGVWYFLSRDDLRFALWSGFGAVVSVLLAVTFHIDRDISLREPLLPDVKLPKINSLSKEEVEKYEHDHGSAGGDISTAKRLVTRKGAYGDRVVAEAEVTAFGPAHLPQARRSESMPASLALDAARVAAASWSKDARLVYVIAGTLDVAHSATKGFYLQVYRWLFLYRSSNGTFLLVCVDSELNVTALTEWSEKRSSRQDLKPFVSDWKVDCAEVTEAAIEHGAVPTGSPPFLRMNDIRGRNLLTWILPFNGSYVVSAVDKTLLFDPLDEAIQSGLVKDFRTDLGEVFQGFSTQESVTNEFVRRFGKPPATEYEVVRDFRTRAQLMHRFPKWTTYFLYSDPVSRFYGIATSATVRGESAEPLATGRLVEIFEGGIRVEEIHFDGSGRKLYEGEITFDTNLGVKTGERPMTGRKTVEYLFFWTS